MCWTVMVSQRENEQTNFSMEREATIEVFIGEKEIHITYLPQNSFNDRSTIKVYEIESTARPCALTFMLKLEGTQEKVKIRFGCPGGKSAFVEAITLVR
jgi:hypothetical protein